MRRCADSPNLSIAPRATVTASMGQAPAVLLQSGHGSMRLLAGEGRRQAMGRTERSRRSYAAGYAALAVTLSGCTTADVAGANWDGAQSTATFPERAARFSQEGWSVLRCKAGPMQEARDCAVIAEAPEGWGFAVSALRMAPSLRAREATPGQLLPKPGDWFNIPIRFCLPTGHPLCEDSLDRAIAEFVASTKASEEALERGDCSQATRLAARIDQSAYQRSLMHRCKPRPEIDAVPPP